MHGSKRFEGLSVPETRRPGGHPPPRAMPASKAAKARDMAADVEGDAEAPEGDLAAAGVDHVIILDRGPLHAAADGFEFGGVEFAGVGVHVGISHHEWQGFIRLRAAE